MSVPTSYRPDIDGLRALAVAGVVLFHVDERWMPGGFVGVDVFFVISGYLITSILRREMDEGRFSLGGFYERRIRRIFPALAVMLGVVLGCGWLIMLPDDFWNLTRSVRYAVISLANVHLMRRLEGYFSPEDVDLPLLHTWSLAVEEQFYLVYPLVLWGLYRVVGEKRRVFGWVAAVGLVLLAGSEWMVRLDTNRGFFLLPWRAWELLLGAVLAGWEGGAAGRRVSEAAGFAGLAMIGGAMVCFDGGMTFPGLAALVPCVGAGLLIHGGRNEAAFIRRVMGWKPLVGLGLISYSVYLWHWPLVSFAAQLLGGGHGYGLGIVAGSVALGWLSWRFVELRFRRGGGMGRRGVYVSCAAVVVGMCLVEWVVKKGGGFPGRFDDEALLMAKQERPDWSPSEGRGRGKDEDLGKGMTVLWGDSHAVMLMPALVELADEMNWKLVSFARNGHPPLPAGWEGPVSKEDAEKREIARKAYEDLKADREVRVVVIGCRWWVRLGVDGRGRERRYEELRKVIHGLVDAGKRVVLVHPVPEIPLNVPRFCARRMKWGLSMPEHLPEAEASRRWNPEVSRFLKECESMGGVMSFRPGEVLLKSGLIDVRSGDVTLYRDEDHLSPNGALLLKEGLREVLEEAHGR